MSEPLTIGTRMVDPNSWRGRSIYVVIADTRVSWILAPADNPVRGHGERKLAKDTLVERQNSGCGSSSSPWRTEEDVFLDEERRKLRLSIEEAMRLCRDVSRLRRALEALKEER